MLIELEGVGKRYPGRTGCALEDVSLRLDRGDSVAIVGRSGSGKSTLLNILATLDEGTSGRYRLDERDVSALWPATPGWRPRWLWAPARGVRRQWAYSRIRRKLGFMFQVPWMLGNFTVAENIALTYRVRHGAPPPQADLDKLLQDLDLVEHAGETANRLSGGQRQRVAIGRALIHQPDVLFADEPTGSLDEVLAGDVIKLLKSACQQRNVALILVTHDPVRACEAASRVIALHAGRVIFEGVRPSPHQIRSVLKAAACPTNQPTLVTG